MTDLPDGELLRRYRDDGDSDSFALLVTRHQAAQFRHARALLGMDAACEDVVQETFLKLAQSPPRTPREVAGRPDAERAHFLAWLHRVTRNGCMDLTRSETTRRRREEAAAPGEATPGGQAQVEADDTRTAVERSLEGLPPEQREVLVLRLFGERSYREIAEITGKKVGTVGWLVSAGLKALSEKLEPLLGLEANAGQNVRGELG